MPKTDLNLRQRRAIASLMTSPTLAAAARESKVSERQLYRWLDDPTFQMALRSAQDEALSATVRRLATLSAAVVNTLYSAMRDDTAPIGSKIRAADIALTQLMRLKELHDLEERIAALERGGHGNAR